MYEWGHISSKEYRTRYTALEVELSRLREPEKPGIIEAGEYLETLSSVWKDATDEEKRALLYGAIEAVYIRRYNDKEAVEEDCDTCLSESG